MSAMCTREVIAIAVLYMMQWTLLMFDKLLPLARPTASVLCAVLMLLVRRILHADDQVLTSGYDSIDFGTIGLLSGVMLIAHLMEKRSHLLDSLRSFLCPPNTPASGHLLLFKVVVLTVMISPVLMNDTACILITPLIGSMCGDNGYVEVAFCGGSVGDSSMASADSAVRIVRRAEPAAHSERVADVGGDAEAVAVGDEEAVPGYGSVADRVRSLERAAATDAALSGKRRRKSVASEDGAPGIVWRPSPLQGLPLLVALSTTANISSAMTSMGNPQNNVIDGKAANINLFMFLKMNSIPAVVCVFVNLLLLAWFYRTALGKTFMVVDSSVSLQELMRSNAVIRTAAAAAGPPIMAVLPTSSAARDVEAALERKDDTRTPLMNSMLAAFASDEWDGRSRSVSYASHTAASEDGDVGSLNGGGDVIGDGRINGGDAGSGDHHTSVFGQTVRSVVNQGAGRTTVLPKSLVVCSLLAMVLLDVLGVPADAVATALGFGLVAIYAVASSRSRGTGVDEVSDKVLEQIDISLLFLFLGSFICVGALSATGLPTKVFNATVGEDCLAHPTGHDDQGMCVPKFVAVVMLLSNLFSNMPVVEMLTPMVAGLSAANQHSTWMLTSWVATVSGNLLLVGSAANLIVAQGAKELGIPFTAWEHAKFGTWSTVIIVTVGVGIQKLVPWFA